MLCHFTIRTYVLTFMRPKGIPVGVLNAGINFSAISTALVLKTCSKYKQRNVRCYKQALIKVGLKDVLDVSLCLRCADIRLYINYKSEHRLCVVLYSTWTYNKQAVVIPMIHKFKEFLPHLICLNRVD